MGSAESKEWKIAMDSELGPLWENETWELVPRPPGRKVVQPRWVFTKKSKLDGKQVLHKARLVAKDFTQKYGMDYQETFSPTIRPETVRILFALAAQKDMEIQQMDVVTAFLNGWLDEEIYMAQPEGFKEYGPDGGELVCKLKGRLYGLQQAPLR